MVERYIRNKFSQLLTGKSEIALEDKIPSFEDLIQKFQEIDESGIYLHIPFCDQICPYCPYNKEIYNPDVAAKYTLAVGISDFFVQVPSSACGAINKAF